MTTGDLTAFLDSVRRSGADNTARLVFADWLDENHSNPSVRLGDLPKGFNAHWHEHVMYVSLGVRGVRRGPGKWSNADILAGLTASKTTGQGKDVSGWAARIGAANVGGYPVLISEPTMDQTRALDVCRALQWAAGGCPVSFNRCPNRKQMRICVWFTAIPPEVDRAVRVVATMDALHAASREARREERRRLRGE